MPETLSEPVVMDCGHSTTDTQPTPWAGPGTSRPICNDCWPLSGSVELARVQPAEYWGRTARCTCGATAPSDDHLAFFEYCGEGSDPASKSCKHCRFHEVVHIERDKSSWHRRNVCEHFEPAGALEFDRWYCGHSGWN